MFQAITMGSLLALFALSFHADAGIPVGDTGCADFTGANKKEQQLKQDMNTGQHEKSAANTFGQLLGKRVRQVNISTWVSGYLEGHAAASGKTATMMKTEEITAWLMQYCTDHVDANMQHAANALAMESNNE